MTTSRDTLSKAETINVAAVETDMPAPIEARKIVAALHLMIRRKTQGDLCACIERGATSSRPS